MLKPEFYLLAQECDLAKASLLGAFTAFVYMDVNRTGTMYSAFFQAGVGLERLMKLVVLIDHNIKHDLANPTNEQLKRIGHDLVVLYDRCSALAVELALEPAEWFRDDSPERKLLVFLSTFAKGSRYYNLDAISGVSRAVDPVKEWIQLHQQIAETHIPYRVREKLNEEAIKHCDSLGAIGWQRWLDGQYISSVDACYLTWLLQKGNPYCVWTLIRILKPFYRLLDILCDRAHAIELQKGIDDPIVPYATEFFPFFLASLDSVKQRKNWTRLF
jgi:hypothetical protein